MLSREEQNYYNRHLLLEDIAEEGQLALKNSHVVVIGGGGLGSPVLSYLAGAGVGHLAVVDGDRVSLSNLHRQPLYGHNNVGELKTAAAIPKLKELNPYIELKGFSENLTAGNALEIIKNYDIVVDATDNFPVRYLINDACITLGKPWVFASIDRFQGQLSVLNYEDGPSYRCLFPRPPSPGTARACSQIGVLGVLAGILGSMQANEVIKMITGRGDVLSGKLLMIDSQKNVFYNVAVKKNEKSASDVLDLKSGVADSEYYNFCSSALNGFDEISVEEIKRKIDRKEKIQFLDIRSENYNDGFSDALHIPLKELDQKIDMIDVNVPVVVYCEKGVDSMTAVDKLKNSGLKNVFSLLGGMQAWKTYQS